MCPICHHGHIQYAAEEDCVSCGCEMGPRALEMLSEQPPATEVEPTIKELLEALGYISTRLAGKILRKIVPRLP